MAVPERAANDREVVCRYRDDVPTLRGLAQVRLSPEAALFFGSEPRKPRKFQEERRNPKKNMKKSSRQKLEKSQKIMFFRFSLFHAILLPVGLDDAPVAQKASEMVPFVQK